MRVLSGKSDNKDIVIIKLDPSTDNFYYDHVLDETTKHQNNYINYKIITPNDNHFKGDIISSIISNELWIMYLNDFNQNTKIKFSGTIIEDSILKNKQTSLIYFNEKKILIFVDNISDNKENVYIDKKESIRDNYDFYLKSVIPYSKEDIYKKFINKEPVDIYLMGGVTKELLIKTDPEKVFLEDFIEPKHIKILADLQKGVNVNKIKDTKTKVQVVNLRDRKEINKCDQSIIVPVDRTSVLGNPYAPKSILDKQNAIDFYRNYFYEKIESGEDQDFINAIDDIVELTDKYENVFLGCWCAPGNCHGDIIAEYINKQKEGH